MNQVARRLRVLAGLEPDPGAKRKGGGPKHASRLPFALLVGGLVIGGLVLLLGLNTASAANELNRQAMTDRDAGLSASAEQLSNEVAASAAPDHLARAAAALGMVPANAPAFVVIGASGSPSLLGKPGAASEAPLAAPATRHRHHRPNPSSTSSSSTSSSSTSAGANSAKNTSSPTATSSSSSKPTSTPTPTVTLPGGNR